MSGRIRNDSSEPPPPQSTAPPAETEPAPPPESTPPPESVTAPPETVTPSHADAVTPTQGDTPPEQLTADEFKKRLARESREKWEARRDADLQRQRVAELERQFQQTQPDPQTAAIEQAKQQLRQEQALADFNRRCNEVYSKGRAEYGEEMDQAVHALNAVGYDPRQRPDVLDFISSLPDAHRVYRTLAADLDRAGRLLQQPPGAWQVELARMALGQTNNPSPQVQNGATGTHNPEPATHITRAPAPLTPVGGNSGRGAKRLDQMSIAEFIRDRDSKEFGSSRIRR